MNQQSNITCTRSRHRICVEAIRKVRRAGGVTLDVHRKDFAFGRQQTYATGNHARQAAAVYAAKLLDHSSRLVVIDYNGHKGTVSELKASERTFDTSWASAPFSEILE